MPTNNLQKFNIPASGTIVKMIGLRPDTISDIFADYASEPQNARARDIIVCLARYLHSFVREANLTHDEWRAGLAALTRAGEITTAERNEFVLFSDMLGVSSLVDMINSPPEATPSSVLGPFHQRGAPALTNGGDLWKGQPGEVIVFEGRVIDGHTSSPVANASLDIWQNANNGLYAAEDPDQPPKNYHALLQCGDDGEFAFTTTQFKPYTVPSDGPAGDMLRLLGRTAWRPAHLHLIVEAEGYRSVVTELFLDGDEWLQRDAAFGVRDELIMKAEICTDRASLPPTIEARDSLPSQFLRIGTTIRLARLPEKC